MVEQAIRERLLDMAPVTALVGTRVYMLKLPQRPTLPAVRVQAIDENEDQHLRGPEGLRRSRVQVDAFASESQSADPYDAAADLAAAVHGDGLGPGASGLFGFIGDLGGSPATVRVVNIRRAYRRTWYEPDELRIVRVQQDYMVEWMPL